MNKLITWTVISLFLIIYAGKYLYEKGVTSYIPRPYTFEKNIYPQTAQAPIIIMGDELAVELSKFKDLLAKEISSTQDIPIKIQSFATNNEGLHRTLHRLKSFKQVPPIIIYLGGSQEHIEKTFQISNIDKIKKNFELFNNIYIQSALYLWKDLSRLLYMGTKYTMLSSVIKEDKAIYTDDETIRAQEIRYKLFEYNTRELFEYATAYNAMMIAISTPLNYQVKPQRSCRLSMDEYSKELMEKAKSYYQKGDYKLAYNLSKELTLLSSSNADAHYFHAQVSMNLFKNDEAIDAFSKAAAFDCKAWRGSPVYNAILKKEANRAGILLFDMDQMIKDQFPKDNLFINQKIPTDKQFKKVIKIIAARVKKRLKL